jgi:hypothetical protein
MTSQKPREIPALLMVFLLASTAPAQPPPGDAREGPRLALSYDGQTPINPPRGLALRPNQEQAAFLLVENPAPLKKRFSLRLLLPREGRTPARPDSPVAPPGPVEFARAEVEVSPGETAIVAQWQQAGKPQPGGVPPGTPPAPAPAPAAPPVPVVLPELPGPPFAFLLEVSDGELSRKVQVPVTIVPPQESVRKPLCTLRGNRLEVVVASQGEDLFRGPPCPVALELDPLVIPGLEPIKSRGAYQQTLKTPDQQVILAADGLRFRPGPRRPGVFGISVDGCPRTFLFTSNFFSQGEAVTPTSVTEPAMRLVVDRQIRAAARLAVRVEVDNYWGDGLLRLGLTGAGVPASEIEELPGAREQHVRLPSPRPDGALLFRTEVREWVRELNAKELYGPCKVQAWLVSPDEERSTILSASAPVTLVGTSPLGVQFVTPLPRQKVRRDRPLYVVASGEAAESGVRQVLFFVGKPGPDHTLPAGVVALPGTPVKGQPGSWATRLVLPAEARGFIELGVVFTNNVGASNSASVPVEVVDAPPPPKASIEVTVMEGSRPQNDVPVELVNARGQKTEQKTKDGKAQFKNLAPGKYRVSASKVASSTSGSAEVEVKEGEEKTATIKLLRP